MHLYSGNYYYNYVIIGVLGPLWLNINSKWMLNNKIKMIILLKKLNAILMKMNLPFVPRETAFAFGW